MRPTFLLPLLLVSPAWAQQSLPAVNVSGRSAPLGVSAFGDLPPARQPLQSLRIDAERLSQMGARGLAALPQLDASVSDAYNSLGYSAGLRVRGFDLDNRYNVRRDGLPVSGETAFGLFNKEALEVLKGASGLQAGVSSPAGLLNLVTKRPDAPRLDLVLSWEQPGTVTAQLDWAQRGGPNGAFGWRLNASSAKLDPTLKTSRGERQGLALAGDWRLNADTLLEAEVEATHQSQPTQPGHSLLGNRLPSLTEFDRNRNLNDPAWRVPTVFDNRFASLRLTQTLAPDWTLSLQAGLQRAQTDDRVAFPFGCYEAATEVYWADRYCPDGSFDRYDFRSDHERRDNDSLRAVLNGRWGAHQLRLEALHHRFRARFERQAFNYAGTGSVFGPEASSAAPELTDENTHRDERAEEWAVSDQWQQGALTLFGGLRTSRIERRAVRTDGSRPTAYRRQLTTPWLGVSWLLGDDVMLYASHGEGLETEVAPNRRRYRNAGESLLLKSRQREVGVKVGSRKVEWGLAAFDVRRPAWSDIGPCDADNSCVRQADGDARHRGVEAQADLKWQGGGLLVSVMALHARRDGAQSPGLNGLRPVNVPARSARLTLRQQVTAGWQAQASLVHEGRRAALPDNTIEIPAWTRLNLGLQGDLVGGSLRWRVGVDNVTNRSAWRESPYQFGHSYLFPLASRQWSASLESRL